MLPDDILAAARSLAETYWNSPIRPRLGPDVAIHWDQLIEAWADTVDLPLFIRKQQTESGDLLIHAATQRELAPCDNSPAHWAILSAFHMGTSATLDDVRAALAAHRISVTMAMSKTEIEESRIKGVLAANPDLNASEYGWKVDHIDEVGLKQRGDIREMPIESLKQHFKRLMKPSNIVLVPSKLKGLGDMPEFLRLLREERMP